MNKKNLLKIAIKVYVFTWLFAVITLIVSFFIFFNSLEGVKDQLSAILGNRRFLIVLHLIFLLFFILFLLFRYIILGYRIGGFAMALKRGLVLFVLPVGLGYAVFKGIVFSNKAEAYDYTWNTNFENALAKPQNNYCGDGKQRGMSVFRLGGGEHPESMKALVKDHVEWVAVIPFLYQEHEQTKQLRSNASREGWTLRDSLLIRKIDTLHAQGMYVHLKPHVWLGEGWRSNIRLADEHWDGWFVVYQNEMLHYAKIAQKTGVGLFCIGTELRTVIKNRPNAWTSFIRNIKKVYTGKLTYAANWDDPIEQIPFWEEMDYIGIQAYFPLTDHKYPAIAAIQKGWEQHLPALERASQRYQKPILFTEIGYRSDASAAIKPWEWGSRLGVFDTEKSDRTQQYAYEALFETFWDKDWFAGCYIWQWHTNTNTEGMRDNVDFTPRFKPAENTIAKWYGTPGERTLGFD